ncbi:MAG: EVE domain-containing protein [Patescibacteria group bacterium]
MQYWLMKSEPDEYSIADLARDTVEMWDGVRNYQVRNMMRDEMQVGDQALFYHSNAGAETGVVGVMKIARTAYPDPTQFDPQDPHYDPKSSPEQPRWLCVDVRYHSTLPRVVTLSEIKADHHFAELPLVQRGNRLSVMPIKRVHFDRLVRLGQHTTSSA